MITIFLLIAILAILIFVHEFGHFIIAKRSGARVEEFGFGFPPRVFGVKKGETVYSLNLLPIGGFVKIFGEDGDERKDKRSFGSKSIATRALIIGAGVIMNMLLAAILLSFGHMIGLPQVIDGEGAGANVKNIAIRVAEVAKNSPAESADIKNGDVIYAMGLDHLRDVAEITEIQNFTNEHLGEKIKVVVKRGNAVVTKELVPRVVYPEGEGPIGIAMVKTGQISYPFYIAPFKGVESTAIIAWNTVQAFVKIFADLFMTGKLTEDLAGPIGIAVITGEVQKMGFIFLLQFVALMSINLAIINVLPIPALDGGRLLFLAIEKIKGSPVKQKYEKMAHTIGFAVLVFLMILVTFRDIGKLL